jgi:hypothetical protein
MRDQFIVFFTEGRHAAFAELGEDFVVGNGLADHFSFPELRRSVEYGERENKAANFMTIRLKHHPFTP